MRWRLIRCWVLDARSRFIGVGGWRFHSPFPRRDAERLDVYEHVADGGDGVADFVLHVVGDFMRTEHGFIGAAVRREFVPN